MSDTSEPRPPDVPPSTTGPVKTTTDPAPAGEIEGLRSRPVDLEAARAKRADADKAEAEEIDPHLTPEVLRNKGVPVAVYRLGEDGRPVEKTDGEFETEEKTVRYTANTVAAIEEEWDGIAFKVAELITEGDSAGEVVVFERTYYGAEGFQQVMEKRPLASVRKVLSIAWGVSPEEAGAMMIPDRFPDYASGVNVAWAMTNGMDPSAALELHRESKRAQIEAAEGMAKAMRDQMDAAREKLADEIGNTAD